VDQVLQGRERQSAGGLDDGPARAIPATAVQARALTIQGLESRSTEAVDVHRRLAVDAVLDPAQDSLHGQRAGIAIEQ